MMLRSARGLALALLVLAIAFSAVGPHATASARKHAVSASKGKSSKGKSKSKKKRRRRRPVGPRLYSGVPLKILSKKTTAVAPGVTYTLETVSRNKWRVGIVHADLREGYAVGLFKAKEKAVGFERVEDLVHRLDSARGLNAVAAVNANYWRAGIGTVLGAAVCDGEVVSFDNIKQWSRLVVKRDGTFAIAPDSLAGSVRTPNAGTLLISGVNTRLNDTGIVLYNHFFGATLPPLDTSMHDSLALRKGIGVDSSHTHIAQDTTELFYETDEDWTVLPDSLIPKARSEEYTLKCMAVDLDVPAVNAPWRCRIVAMTSHMVPLLQRGIALSFPRSDSMLYRKLHTGDTITVMFQSGDGSGGAIEDMLMAGPRLVRNGRVSVETDRENFRRKSFIAGGHARTAIGFNEDQDEVILVTVDRPFGTRKVGRPGIGLSDLARILVAEGAADAMNFDGGSSTTLVVNGATVVPDTGKEFSRHVAAAVAIIRSRKPTGETLR